LTKCQAQRWLCASAETTTPSICSTRWPGTTPARAARTWSGYSAAARERPDDLNRTPGPAGVVAAAAVVAAGLPGGEAVARETTGYHDTAIVIPHGDLELTDAAIAALLIAAGRDGRMAPGRDRCRHGTAGPPDD
jgi:hypothetical protein